MTVRAPTGVAGTHQGPLLTDAARRRRWDVVVGGGALLLLGLQFPLAGGVTTATVAVLALAPVWLGVLPRARGASWVLALTLLAVPTGLMLAWWTGPASGRDWSPRVAAETALLLLTAVGAVGLLVWARGVMPLRAVAGVVGVGLLLDGVLSLAGSQNPWKYQLSVPVTVLVLAWVGRDRPRLAATALVALAVVGVLNEYRSYAAFCVLAGLAVLWRTAGGGRRSPARVLAVIGATGFAAYQLGTELLLRGYLGEELQQRSTQQVRDAGSLLAGGRPEWSATARLVAENPAGLGLGAVPSSGDVRVARQGLSTVGVDGGYVTNYLLGGQFRLHSVIADLWAAAGAVGLALALLLVALVVRGLVDALASHRPDALSVFLCLTALWFLCFGPIYSDLPDIALAVGLTTRVALRVPPRTGG